MEKYFKCEKRNYCGMKDNPEQYLTYVPYFGKTKIIPIILVNDDGNIFEFFTKTKFNASSRGNGYCSSGYELPDSTLFYYFNSSYPYYCREIFPIDALKELEPFMKNPSKYSERIISYFDWFRADFVRKQQEADRKDKENANAQSVLSRFWENR